VKWACFFMLPPLNCICHYKLRRDIKSDHGVDQGGCIRDALAVTFCACCAIIQDWLQFLHFGGRVESLRESTRTSKKYLTLKSRILKGEIIFMMS